MNLSSFTLVPQLDRSPRWVTFAQTLPGKLALVSSFAGLLFVHGNSLWWLISLYLLIFSLLPQLRWQILLVATWTFLLFVPTGFHWEHINTLFRNAAIPWQISSNGEGLPLILAAILFAALCLYLARSSPLSRHLKRPVLTLICLYLGLMISASYAPLTPAIRAVLWAFLAVFGQYFWFVCYSLKECRAPNQVPLLLQFGQYRPFWLPGMLPYNKSAGYLRKIEAKTAEEFAICQLKGFKLLLWALWLKLFTALGSITVFGYGDLMAGRLQFKRELGTVQMFLDGNFLKELVTLPFSGFLPRYETAFNLAANGTPLPWHTNWAVLITNFLYILLYAAFTTHIIIAIVRMCGFNALRNTYRPLSSKTIAEFWNRYFYYFKELLVEFFFYPTFFRYFKKRPRLRMYTATMAAAFFGNFLFHFMRDIWVVVELGFFEAMVAFHTHFIYAFVLGNVIFLSQARKEKVSQSKAGLFTRFFTPIRVFGFYCLLSIFVDFRRAPISDNISFLLSLLPFQVG
jgi:hypothetical protein